MKKILTAFSIAAIIFACTGRQNEKNTRSADEVMLIASPAADSCAEPYLFTDKNGLVYLSWTEKKGKESSLNFCVLSGDKWSKPLTIASGNNWFVNWADYPVMASDGNKNLIAHYLEKSDTAKFTYDIKIISSTDSGKTWSPSKILHDDNVKAEHGFVSTASFEGGFIVAWLDGRKSASDAGAGGHDGHHGEMTLRGAILDHTGDKAREWELDSRICDCCQTGVAITDNGPIVVYRDRSDHEVRDISAVRYVNGQWTSPERIYPDNWQIKACPVNGPRISALGNDLAIAWFSIKNKIGEVKLIFSKDGGNTFSKPVRIDEGNSIGRVGVVMLDSATAMASWMEGADIKVVKVHADGSKEIPITIAASSEKRSGGFPQMTKSGNKVFFAWTDDKAKTIRTASISL